MLKKLDTLLGCSVHAADDESGEVEDVFFDDSEWKLRYVVVDTGGWLDQRLVVLSPEAITSVDWDDETVRASLTRDQIEKSPEIPSGEPFIRQVEDRVARYYGWPQYWATPAIARGLAPPSTGPGVEPPSDTEMRSMDRVPNNMEKGEPNLRSLKDVRGYQIHATDGAIGELDDLVVDDTSWEIPYAIVTTRRILPGGKKVLVARDAVRRVDWIDAAVDVDLSIDAIKNGPTLDDDTPITTTLESRVREAHRLAPRV